MEVLYTSQKETIGFVYFLIKSLNLFKVLKILKRDNTFKIFIVEYIKEIIKNKISVIASNPKLDMSSSKISPCIIEKFSMLIIDNKHAKNVSILLFLLRTSANNISVSSHPLYRGIENLDGNNKSDKNETEVEIEFEDKINWDILYSSNW